MLYISRALAKKNDTGIFVLNDVPYIYRKIAICTDSFLDGRTACKVAHWTTSYIAYPVTCCVIGHRQRSQKGNMLW